MFLIPVLHLGDPGFKFWIENPLSKLIIFVVSISYSWKELITLIWATTVSIHMPYYSIITSIIRAT
jgi:hypothetical protein